MIKHIGNAVVAIVAISAVAFICWVAGMFASALAYFGSAAWFDVTMPANTQENVAYVTFAAGLIIALAMFLRSTWQGVRN